MTQAAQSSLPDPPTPLDAIIGAAADQLRDFPGGRVLPLCSTPSSGKMPMIRGGCASATANIGELVGLFSQADAYGFGLSATGYAYYPAPDIVVFDYDVKGDKDGLADLAHLEQRLGCKLPDTATVRSPSGAGHRYFQLPPGTALPHILIGKMGRLIEGPNGKPLPTGLDIFGYSETKSLWVAGPGTKTPRGEYAWVNDAPVATLPPAWVAAIQAAKPPRPPRDPSAPRAERERVTLGYIEGALAAIDPDGLGHDRRFMVRAVVMEAAVLGADGHEIPGDDKIGLLREWCARNPKFDDNAFDRSINSVLDGLDDDTVNRAGLGSLHALAKEHGYSGPTPSVALSNAAVAAQFRDHTLSSSTTTSAGDRYSELVKHFAGCLAAGGGRELCGKMFGEIDREDIEAKWLIQNWLPQGGVVAVVGESGAFKTYTLIDMFLCKATGTPWARRHGFDGYWVGEASHVAMFAGEGPRGVVRRFNAAIAGKGFDRALVNKNLMVVKTVYALNRPDGLAGMAMEIEAKGIRPSIIGVDTFILGLDGNEDSSEVAKNAIVGARALAVMFDAVVVVIDHTGHGDKTRQRGSSAKKANQDGVILVARTGDTVKLTQEKNRDADKDKFAVGFKSRTIELGRDRETGEPITDLCFDAIDPGTTPNATSALFQDQTGVVYAQFDACARRILDAHFGGDIRASDLARLVVAEMLPELLEQDAKYIETWEKYRKHLVGGASLARYVADKTPSGKDASTFRNPVQNGRRARRHATHPGPATPQ